MKKILFLAVLAVSTVTMASVVPTESVQIKKPKVSTMDRSKFKIIRKKPVIEKKDNDAVAKLQRYNGVVTDENINSLENMSRLMQENPSALMAQFGAKNVVFEENGEVTPYQKTDPNASPAERLNNLQPPSLTATLPGLKFTKEDVKREQQKALKQIEIAGRKQLGQKQSPITQPMTVEDIKNSGIDTSILPENWEEIVNQNQKRLEEYRKKQLQSDNQTAEEAATDKNSEESTSVSQTRKENKAVTVQKAK